MFLFQKLKLPAKFFLIALLFATPIASLGYLFVQQSQKDILLAEREREGVAYLRSVWPVYHASVAGREPSAGEAGNLASAAARYDAAMGTSKSSRALLAGGTGTDRIEAGQSMIQKVADGSALTLDPDLDSYYLMDITTLKVPELAAAMRALLEVAERMSSGRADADAHGELAFAIGRLDRGTRALRSSFDSAHAGNVNDSVKHRLDEDVRNTLLTVERLTRQARSLYEATNAGSTQRVAIPALTAQHAAAQAQVDQLWGVAVDDLDGLLERRISRFENRLLFNLGLTFVLLVLVIGLMITVSRSITRRLHTVSKAMDGMRQGSLETVIPHQDGGDEISEIARTLEVFRERLISLRAFEGDLIAQEANKAADLRFRDMLDVSPIGAIISTADGRTLYSNKRFAEIVGVDEHGMLSSNSDAGYVDPGQRRQYNREMARTGRVGSMQVSFKRADGAVAICLLSGETMEYEGEEGSLTWVYEITELKKAEEEVRTTQTRLIQSEKLASLGQLTAGIAHEIKNPLNFVNNFSDVSRDLVGELVEVLAPAKLDETVRVDVDEIVGMISSNLDKVVQHGKRADSIVKNMLLHSREDGGDRRSVDLNAIVEESLNLAYHGARAEKQDFNVTLERHFDPAVGNIEIFPQEFTRVLLNIISNGFYASHKRKIESGDAGFEPTMTTSTAALPDRYEIRIRDNGGGIPDAVREKIFTPFFTTKPPGEGTGLGLSLSHDIVVKQHGGTIDIDTRAGEFTEFIVTLPRPPEAPSKRLES